MVDSHVATSGPGCLPYLPEGQSPAVRSRDVTASCNRPLNCYQKQWSALSLLLQFAVITYSLNRLAVENCLGKCCTHTHTHIHTHAHKHTHARTNTRTHMHTRSPLQEPQRNVPKYGSLTKHRRSPPTLPSPFTLHRCWRFTPLTHVFLTHKTNLQQNLQFYNKRSSAKPSAFLELKKVFQKRSFKYSCYEFYLK